MRSRLVGLIGQRVARLERVHDYWQLSIAGEVLDIINPMEITGAPRAGGGTLTLEGLELKDVHEDDDSLMFRFGGGATLRVDLRDDAYVGPEAVVYHRKDGTAVVW